MVKMTFFRPTPKVLFLSFLILSIGAAYMYMYISNNGVELSHKEMVAGHGALAGEKDNRDSLAEAEKEQSRRLATFRAYCAKSSSTLDPSQAKVKSHVLIYDNIKTVYCYVPKAACKTMKLLLYNLEYNKTELLSGVSKAEFLADKRNYTARHEHRPGWIHGRGHNSLKQYSEEEASLRLATYRKIIVVRDPLERLASAWLNKFVYMPEQNGNFGWVRSLNRRLRTYQERNLPDKSSKVKEEEAFNATKPVPFRDFLFAVSKRLIDNEHWTSYNRLCLPCQINYDFIAHTDTVASDVRLFLKKNNITANEDVLPEQRPRQANHDNVFGNIYGQVPIEDILPLRDIFQEDFDMFGYSFEQDLAKILEAKEKV